MAGKKSLVAYIPILVGIFVGAGITFGMYAIPGIREHAEHQDMGMRMLFYSCMALLLYFSFFVQIFIHEAGHLIFGLLSGYKFVSFRIMTLTLVLDEGRIRIKWYKLAGAGGQCLMAPPETEYDRAPYKLYNAGGVILNFVTGVLTVLLLVVCNVPYPLDVFLVFLSFWSFLSCLLNGIPMKVGGMPNDAYNMRMAGRDPYSRKALYLQLRVNALQSSGMRLKEMSEDWFVAPGQVDLGNSLHACIKFMAAGRCLDKLDFEKAKVCFQEIELSEDKLIPFYQKELRSELLFLEIAGECRKEVIDRLYTAELQEYVKIYAKYMMSKIRLLYAYALLVDRDPVKAGKLMSDAKKIQKRYPVKGDAESEMEIMRFLKNRS